MNDLTPLDVDVFVDIYVDVDVDFDDGFGDGRWLPWRRPWSVHWSQVVPSANPELRNQSIPNAGKRRFVHILKTMSTFRSSNSGLQSSWRSARDRRYFFFSKTDSTCSKYIKHFVLAMGIICIWNTFANLSNMSGWIFFVTRSPKTTWKNNKSLFYAWKTRGFQFFLSSPPWSNRCGPLWRSSSHREWRTCAS